MAKAVNYVTRQLVAGKTPEQLGGKKIGQGVCKAAYLFESPAGGYVVKENAQGGMCGEAQRLPPKEIYAYGARAPRTYKAGKYLIQEYVTPISHLDKIPDEVMEVYRKLSKLPYDIHAGNCGVDANGQVVVFDW